MSSSPKSSQPIPYDWKALRERCVDRVPEPFEAFLPSQAGFITDFVAGLFNSESPLIYTTWAGIWTLALAIKREAFIRWFEDDPLFANFYIILSGPPSNKKGKAIGRAVRVYKEAIGPIGRHVKEERPAYTGRLREPWALVTKTHVPILTDSSTTRPLKDALNYKDRKYYGHEFGLEFPLAFSDGRLWTDESGREIIYTKTSEIGIVAEELSMLLGRQQYNEGLVQLLLGIYSTDLEREDRTAMYGVIKMRGLCTNLLAGTTPVSFREAISDSAKGDGFLSRTIIAHQSGRYQRFFPPPEYPFLPGVDDLASRLAWIAENTLGEHCLDQEARDFAKAWYQDLVYRIHARPDREFFLSRADTHALKLSLLIKAQRYVKIFDNTITLLDLLDAIRLLEATLMSSSGVWSKALQPKIIQAVLQVFKLARKPKTREDLRRSINYSEATIDLVLGKLLVDGSIQIMDDPARPAGWRELFKPLGIYPPSLSFTESYSYVQDTSFEILDEEESEETEEPEKSQAKPRKSKNSVGGSSSHGRKKKENL